MILPRSSRKNPTPRRRSVFALHPLGDPALRTGMSPELVRHARNEAEAIAWTTEVPQLVLPVLFEEKLLALRQWQNRQNRLLGSDSTSFAA